MKFTWDSTKNAANIRKHGISFDVAVRVFEDDDRIEKYDDIHSEDEDRYATIGLFSGTVVVVTVVFTWRDDDTRRIITARKANSKEIGEYYNRKGGL